VVKSILQPRYVYGQALIFSLDVNAFQLSVKREMSNAKAPVLGHFGAAMAGLSTHYFESYSHSFLMRS
jgi:hypothetical protein